MEIDVSIILPVYNAGKWIKDCLKSVELQDFSGTLELSIYDDGSTDDSQNLIDAWCRKIKESDNFSLIITRNGHKDPVPKGVGYAKNRAVKQSRGKYLCFLDADDTMRSDRVRKQLEAASKRPDSIIGSKFERVPPASTPRFTEWANGMTGEQLRTQIYLSHGPTLIMPTWFCARQIFDSIGGFDETGKGTPEDLIFFYSHLDGGGCVHRVDEPLVLYRHHPEATTFTVLEDTIWGLRLRRLERDVLSKCEGFTIWNAGKQGRKFYRSLTSENRAKVICFCDVDAKKIAKGVYIFEESKEIPKPTIPIVHFSRAKAPFIICVKLGLTNGAFEKNLASLNLIEGRDFHHFN